MPQWSIIILLKISAKFMPQFKVASSSAVPVLHVFIQDYGRDNT